MVGLAFGLAVLQPGQGIPYFSLSIFRCSFMSLKWSPMSPISKNYQKLGSSQASFIALDLLKTFDKLTS